MDLLCYFESQSGLGILTILSEQLVPKQFPLPHQLIQKLPRFDYLQLILLSIKEPLTFPQHFIPQEVLLY